MRAPRKYLQESRDRSMRLVAQAGCQGSELSLNAAILRVCQRVGVNPDTLRARCKQAEIDDGKHPGVTTSESQRIKNLKAEVRELKRANEILWRRRVSSCGSSTRVCRGSPVH